MEVIKKLSQIERTVLLWSMGQAGIGLNSKRLVTILPMPKVIAVMNWVMAKDVAGNWIRSNRALTALRNRSLAYRRAGVKQSVEQALADLAGLLASDQMVNS